MIGLKSVDCLPEAHSRTNIIIMLRIIAGEIEGDNEKALFSLIFSSIRQMANKYMRARQEMMVYSCAISIVGRLLEVEPCNRIINWSKPINVLERQRKHIHSHFVHSLHSSLCTLHSARCWFLYFIIIMIQCSH